MITWPFEDVFRLSEDVIRERQRPYVSLLEGRQPVLDVGCGRGEFLELLRADGIAARGVDLDPGMVAGLAPRASKSSRAMRSHISMTFRTARSGRCSPPRSSSTSPMSS